MYKSLKEFGWSVLYTFVATFGVALIAWYNANPGVDVWSFIESGAIVGVVVTCLRAAAKGTVEWLIPQISAGLKAFKKFVDKQK